MQIPQIPDLHNKAVAQAHENRLRLVRELAEQQRAVELAKAKHDAALAADVNAAAQARLEQRPKPKPAVGKAEQALKEATGELAAARGALEKADEAVAEVVERNMSELKQQAGKRVQGGRAKYLQALEVVEVAHGELAIEEATVGWLNQWPNGKGGVGQRYVTDLPPTPNGDPLTTDAVLDALRRRGLPPEPHRPHGALRVTEQGMINPSAREPMIETLISGPEAA